MTTDPAASGPAQNATGHVDPDRLADLAEGLLDATAAEAVRDHLASCEQCADDFALITLDSGLAGFLPPEPIPAEVVARVEAALYREPPLREWSGAAASASARQHVHHAARPSRGRRFKLAFGALASVGVLVGGMAVGVSMFGGSSEKNSTAASSSLSGTAPNAAGRYSGNEPAAPTDALAQLQQQATGLLAAAKSGGTGAASTAKGRPDNALRTPNPAGEPCWQNPSPTADLLAHSSVVFQGRPAELLVYADPGDPARARVVVVAAGCASLDAKTSGAQPQQSVGGTPLPGAGSVSAPVVLAETSITRP